MNIFSQKENKNKNKSFWKDGTFMGLLSFVWRKSGKCRRRVTKSLPTLIKNRTYILHMLAFGYECRYKLNLTHPPLNC